MPEDNKLLVPPFSKKEVKAIAVEGVNEGIADGKIDIPAGGVKLYKHTIHLTKSDSGSLLAYVISDSNEEAIWKSGVGAQPAIPNAKLILDYGTTLTTKVVWGGYWGSSGGFHVAELTGTIDGTSVVLSKGTISLSDVVSDTIEEL